MKILFLFLLLVGCVSTGVRQNTEVRQEQGYLYVKNQSQYDVKVYAVSGGSRNRIGSVTAMSETKWPLRRHHLASGYLQLGLVPFAARDTFFLDAIPLSLPSHLYLTIKYPPQFTTWIVWAL